MPDDMNDSPKDKFDPSDIFKLIPEEDVPYGLNHRKLQKLWAERLYPAQGTFTKPELEAWCKQHKVGWGIAPINKVINFLLDKELLKKSGRYHSVNRERIKQIQAEIEKADQEHTKEIQADVEQANQEVKEPKEPTPLAINKDSERYLRFKRLEKNMAKFPNLVAHDLKEFFDEAVALADIGLLTDAREELEMAYLLFNKMGMKDWAGKCLEELKYISTLEK